MKQKPILIQFTWVQLTSKIQQETFNFSLHSFFPHFLQGL